MPRGGWRGSAPPAPQRAIGSAAAGTLSLTACPSRRRARTRTAGFSGLIRYRPAPSAVCRLAADRARIGRKGYEEGPLSGNRLGQPAEQFPPAPGRSGLDDHDIGRFGGGGRRRLVPAQGKAGREPLRGKDEGQTGRGVRVAVDDQDGQRASQLTGALYDIPLSWWRSDASRSN